MNTNFDKYYESYENPDYNLESNQTIEPVIMSHNNERGNPRATECVVMTTFLSIIVNNTNSAVQCLAQYKHLKRIVVRDGLRYLNC